MRVLRILMLLCSVSLSLAWSNGILSKWKALFPKNGRRSIVLPPGFTERTNTVLLSSSDNEDSAMSAYDRAMASYGQGSPLGAGQGNGRQEKEEVVQSTFKNAQQPSQTDPPLSDNSRFVESNFNNPMYSTQERGNLEQANSWGANTNTGNSFAGPAPPINAPLSSGEEDLPSTQSSTSGADSSGRSGTYQESFIDALSPNSEKLKTGLTYYPDSTPESQQAVADSSEQWEPLLMFEVKDDNAQGQAQQQQKPAEEADESTSTVIPTFPTTGQQMTDYPEQQQAPPQAPPQAQAQPQTVAQPYPITNPFVKAAPQSQQEQTPPQQQSQQPPPPPQQEAQTQTLDQPNPITNPFVQPPPDQQQQQEQQEFGIGESEPDGKLNDFMNTGWEEVKQESVDPFSTVKSVLGIKPEKKKGTPTTPTFTVQPGVTKRILDSLDKNNRNPRAFSQWESFQNAERRWADLKDSRKFRYDFKLFRSVQDGAGPPLQFVSDDCARGNAKCCAKLRDVCEKADGEEECMDLDYEGPTLDAYGQPIMDYDVVVLGGTLGIFYGMALQLQGLNVCVVAPRELKGQEQEWNVAMDDLLELQRMGILAPGDIDAAVTTVFDGTRAGFKNREVTPLSGGLKDNDGTGFECYLNGVLNLGVSPKIILERAVVRFKAMGGVVRERCPLGGIAVSPQVGCAIDLGSYNPDEDVEPITTKLVLDCMGYGSPVARQQRYGQRPDSICMVFGSNAGGYNAARNRFADAIYSFNGLQGFGGSGKMQYFWETFPVGTNLTAPRTADKAWFDKVAFGNAKEVPALGPQVTSDVKTTYMFTYIDANRKRPSLETLMDDYFKLLPTYQPSINNPEKDLKFNRVLYDYFPAYRDSPMKPQYSRVLSVGEAAGLQSPISFGGFRSLSRHLGRVSGAIAEAVTTGCLHKDDLGEINAYMPNLSATWLFRDLMSVTVGKSKNVDPQFTNRVLAVYMKAMYDAGPTTVSPLMHDVLRFDALVATILSGIVSDPVLMADLVKHVGVNKMWDFLGHVSNMGLYALLDTTVAPFMGMMMNKIDDPRMKFQMRRRMEAWKYGSGNDYKND